MATVTFEKAQRWYPGNDKPTVPGIDLEIGDGEFMVLVGPSGCGKSTTLRMLAGLEEINGGKIFIGDRDVTNVAPKDRDIAMVFQNYALYPHMTVADNMGFALKIAGVPKAEIRKKVEDAAEILNLTEYLSRKPKALSGGQRKLVALAACLAQDPDVLLLDEPEAHLDAVGRALLERLLAGFGGAAVAVSHDRYLLDETVSQIAELDRGRIRMWPGNYSAYTLARELELQRQRRRRSDRTSDADQLATLTGVSAVAWVAVFWLWSATGLVLGALLLVPVPLS